MRDDAARPSKTLLAGMLDQAVSEGDVEGTVNALKMGASPLGFAGSSPMSVAVREGHLGCLLELLLETRPSIYGEELNERPELALLAALAAYSGKLECCESLLDLGWSMESRVQIDREGFDEASFFGEASVLGWACRGGSVGVVERLIERGANAAGLWEEARRAISNGRLDIARALIGAGCPATRAEAAVARLAAKGWIPRVAVGGLRWAARRASWRGRDERRAKGRAPDLGGLRQGRPASLARARELLQRCGLARLKSAQEALARAEELSANGALPAIAEDAGELRRLWEVNIPLFLEALLGIPAADRGKAAEPGAPTPMEAAEGMIERALALMAAMRERSLARARQRLDAEIAVMEAKTPWPEERAEEPWVKSLG